MRIRFLIVFATACRFGESNQHDQLDGGRDANRSDSPSLSDSPLPDSRHAFDGGLVDAGIAPDAGGKIAIDGGSKIDAWDGKIDAGKIDASYTFDGGK
jgi:hypothetical protein